ncbi:MAG: hypothetical protein V5A43_05630 [Haloarculaceae archaeon]
MSTETREDAGSVEEQADPDDATGPDDSGEPGEEAETPLDSAARDARNDVAVHFANGEVAEYAFVVRTDCADWLYAERLAGGGDGFDDEEIEALNADQVCRITAPRVHLFGDGVVHFGDDLVVDPATLLADSWFDADATLL